MLIVKIIVLLALCLVGASFALANGEASVPVRYFVASGEVPLVLLVLGTLLVGVLAGLLLLSGPFLAARLRLNRLQHKQRKMEQELYNLRQLRAPEA